MGSFLLKRGAQSLVVLLLISLVAFAVVQAIPGNPARLALGPRAPQASVDALADQYRLRDPVVDQYVHFVGSAVTLDFGRSIRSRQPVRELLRARIGPTMLIVVYAGALSLLVALLLGVAAARRAGRATDATIRVGSMFLVAMPPFWLGLVLVLLLGVQAGIFATSGYETGVAGIFRTLTLPAITVACGLAPVLIRSVRASVRENLTSDYAEAARSRGLGERRVLYRHVLRNSLISTVTILGTTLAFLISGTVVVEYVFGIPGLGTLAVSAVANRDFPIVQALVVVFGVLTLLVNMLADVAYAALDPRVRL